MIKHYFTVLIHTVSSTATEFFGIVDYDCFQAYALSYLPISSSSA